MTPETVAPWREEDTIPAERVLYSDATPLVAQVDVWGRLRYARLYAGAYDGQDGLGCTFCQCLDIKRDARWPRCENPVCPAQLMPGDAYAARYRAELIERAHEDAKREQEERWRRQQHVYSMQRIAEEREARQVETRRRAEAAKAAGQCVRCATEDYYRPRAVRHRGTCPREQAYKAQQS